MRSKLQTCRALGRALQHFAAFALKGAASLVPLMFISCSSIFRDPLALNSRQIPLETEIDNAVCHLEFDSDLRGLERKQSAVTIPSDFRDRWAYYERTSPGQFDGWMKELTDFGVKRGGRMQARFVPDQWVYTANPPLSRRDEHFSYYYDSAHHFRKQHGDGGWVPRVVIAKVNRRNRKAAEAYLNRSNLEWCYEVSEGLKQMRTAYIVIRVMRGHTEESLIVALKRTHSFQYVSRSDAGAGPFDPLNCSILEVSERKIFPTEIKSEIGKQRFEEAIRSILQGWDRDLQLAPMQERSKYYYSAWITGRGEHLATRNRRYWERNEVGILLTRPTELNNKSDKVMIALFLNCSYAKGPPGKIPPQARFKMEQSDENIDGLDLHRRLTAALQKVLGAEIVRNP